MLAEELGYDLKEATIDMLGTAKAKVKVMENTKIS